MADSPAPRSSSVGLESFSLDGKNVVVTGGGRGLGQGIALSVALCGAMTTAVARSRDQLEETRSLAQLMGLDLDYRVADLSKTEDLDGLIEDLWVTKGEIHGIVHAAGVQVRKPAVEVDIDDWRWLHSVNTDAPFFMSTALARRQLEGQCAGSHVFVGSLNSSIGLPNVAPYATSKTALLGMARVMSSEWSGRGIRANVVGPGYFETELTKDLFADEANARRILSRIPMGELGQPEDVGAAVVFLLSDAARYVSGQLLNVDGGWLAS